MSDLAVLDALERLEQRALRWGFVDGALTDSEFLDLAKQILGPQGDAAGALDRLLDRSLLLEVLGPAGDVRLRSRFAETVRLLSRLRQQFPGRPWTTAPRLVSDYRLDIRRRRYPNRDRDAADAFQRISGPSPLPFRAALWSALSGPDLRLADFQEAAARRLIRPRGDTGLIVTAGTGSGKTMAFYLPALTRIAEQVQDKSFWTKALAVYPRTELLQDQFTETYRMARRLDGHLGPPRRPLRLGAYFGSTPNRATASDVAQRGWRKRRNDFVCPWLPCPACGGDLLWRTADLDAERERLACGQPGCATEIGPDKIVMTRRRLVQEPPDILFTTTEMLNQRLSDLGARRLFGVGQPPGKRPIYCLLDEVHTYTGVSGAQAALTLRRWRHALANPVNYVGLSATLREAPRFFADLVGLDPSLVEEVTPGDLIEEGAEYQLLLRGDPASQTSLLSTSIQSLMLLARMLDPLRGGRSDGAFGSRLFAFTDNLDVINRLYDNLRDAEGLSIFGRPQRQPLAALRARPADPTEQARRDRDGQVWRAVEHIGRRLANPLVVGRTSSEDAGVLADADVVVATASLEVGYNDSRVGAVLQHKAPRDAASFLQRRGRAGRARAMRPLTVTVLSDYGRDRTAFEAYEHLFDPELPPQSLPVHNDYVLRMQATYAMFDWLAASYGGPWGWAWDVLSRPEKPGQAANSLRADAKQRLLKLLEGDPVVLESLSNHLAGALKVDAATVEALLWRPPRAVLLEAVPTLARRLHREWRVASSPTPDVFDFQVDWHPLPDFVARTLFTDLSLPEVTIVLPPATVNKDEKLKAMPIAPALSELAPGRVTRRYATEHGGLHHWSPLDPDEPFQQVEVDAYAEVAEPVGHFESDGQVFQVFRPWRVRLDHARRTVAGPTSNARLDWRSQFEPVGEPALLDLGARNPWRRHIREISTYLHRFRSHVTTRRFAVGGEAVLRRLRGDRRIQYAFTQGQAPAALGFELDVDGLAIDLNLTQAKQRITELPADVLASSRLGYLRHRLMTDPDLPDDVDLFQRDWLHQVLVSAAVLRAASTGEDLRRAALALLEDPQAAQRLTDAMGAIFQSQGVADDPHEPDPPDDTDEPKSPDGAASAQGQTLTDLLHRADVRARLQSFAEEMAHPDPTALRAWILDTLVATTAEALLQAVTSLVPRHISAESLVVDVAGGEQVRIWVTESTLGGAGVLQAVFERISDEPRALFTALEAALAPTDLELAAQGLETFIGLTQTDPAVASAVQALRATTSYAQREPARARLYERLSQCGLDVGRALSVSLNARLLTPTASVALDSLLNDLLGRWRALEAQLGLALGVRQIAYVFALDPEIRKNAQAAAGLPQTLDKAEAAQVFANLLWPRGVEIAQQALQSYNRFAPRRSTDPRLARALFQNVGRRIDLDDPDHRAGLASALARGGSAELAAPLTELDRLRSTLTAVLTEPVDVGYLQFFPKLERIERDAGGLVATLVVQEQV